MISPGKRDSSMWYQIISDEVLPQQISHAPIIAIAKIGELLPAVSLLSIFYDVDNFSVRFCLPKNEKEC